MTIRTLSIFLCLLFIFSSANAQQVFEVAILSDAATTENHIYEEALKKEISALLASRFELRFSDVYTGGDIAEIRNAIARINASNQVDVLIGIGMITSGVLADQDTYPIPAIASIQLTDDMDGEPQQTNTVSGISNFTYIKSPFNIGIGIEVLKEICECEHLAVLASPNLLALGGERGETNLDEETEIDWISIESDLNNSISSISDDVKGIYVLSPLTAYSSDEIDSFFDQLIERQLPSFTLLESPVLEHGAYASFTSEDNLNQILRRIAINVEKIAEGKNPKDFPVDIESFTNQLIVNMETVNKIGKYPKWTLLNDALLVNINRPSTTRVLSLKSVIAEGIQNNLGYQIEKKETQISAKDVDLAKSDYLPQLGVESTGFFLDQNSVDNSFGTRGTFNWTAGASFSQIILSEPALANIAIQKLLFESQQQVQNQSELDVILEVTERYFNYLLVLSLAELENNNINAINQNLTIATNKEKAGYGGVSDVYRWQTELNLAKTDLYQANAQLKAARYQLNEALNHPIDEAFTTEGSENIYQFIEEVDQRFLDLIEDQTSLSRLTDFMVSEAMKNLPEIQQIELAIAAQERLLKSNRRSFYIPTVAFGGSYDYPISIVNSGESPPIPGLEGGINPSWNAAFNLSIPLSTGGARKFQKEKTNVGLYQLQDQRKEVQNVLELQVRANMELVNASYNNIRLSTTAAESAEKNIGIVQDLYKSGQVDVITLVDAQNTLLGAQINATNAAYEFMLDLFALQRSIGSFVTLATENQRETFFQRFLNYQTD